MVCDACYNSSTDCGNFGLDKMTINQLTYMLYPRLSKSDSILGMCDSSILSVAVSALPSPSKAVVTPGFDLSSPVRLIRLAERLVDPDVKFL